MKKYNFVLGAYYTGGEEIKETFEFENTVTGNEIGLKFNAWVEDQKNKIRIEKNLGKEHNNK